MTTSLPFDPVSLQQLARQLGVQLQAREWLLATAESCTGGGIAAVVTDIAGSSGWFERGFVTYSNEAKQEMLGVSAATLERVGAVSEETAGEMAAGALRHSKAHLSVAVTGVAGPGGGSPAKPVGTVCFGYALPDGSTLTRRLQFAGDRAAVRAQTVATALTGLLAISAGRLVP
jgi:nicotinamide-nucleotide amidase